MPDFVLTHTQKWLDHFTQQGYRASPLAAGAEGATYDLGGDLIAKVWRVRRAGELELMQHFYADVATARLPFETPEILTIEQVGGVSVTYERKLSGRPLQQRLSVNDRGVEPVAARCVIDVLRALSTVPATEAMRRIGVLDEEQPLWAGADTFRDALTNLLSRRVARFGDVIRAHLGDFDRRYASLRKRLAVLASYPATVIHGDLVPGNILVDEQARPVAVLDFGFLTTAGDPRLDAAIAASVMRRALCLVHRPASAIRRCRRPRHVIQPAAASRGRPLLDGRILREPQSVADPSVRRTLERHGLDHSCVLTLRQGHEPRPRAPSRSV